MLYLSRMRYLYIFNSLLPLVFFYLSLSICLFILLSSTLTIYLFLKNFIIHLDEQYRTPTWSLRGAISCHNQSKKSFCSSLNFSYRRTYQQSKVRIIRVYIYDRWQKQILDILNKDFYLMHKVDNVYLNYVNT